MTIYRERFICTNNSNKNSNLRPFEADFIQGLSLGGLKEGQVPVDYSLPWYIVEKGKNEKTTKQDKEKFSKKREETTAVDEASDNLGKILRESIATLDSIAEDWTEPADVRTKAKELKIAFVEELKGVLAAGI